MSILFFEKRMHLSNIITEYKGMLGSEYGMVGELRYLN